MAESYPYQPAELAAGAAAADVQRLAARLKQEQAQLAVDQRQLKQQRLSLDRLKAELDTRQQELDRSVDAFQRERQAFLDQQAAAEQALEAERSRLQARQTELDTLAADLDCRHRQLDEQARTLQATRDQLDPARRRLDAMASSLESQAQALAARQVAVEQQETELQARIASLADQLAQCQSAPDGVSQQHEQFQADRRQLEQQAADLAAAREQLASQEESLRDRQHSLDAQQEDLRRQLERLSVQQADLRSQQGALESQRQALQRQQADLSSREAALLKREAQLSALQAKASQLARQEQDLQARQAAFERSRQDLLRLEQDLAQKQHDLEEESTAAQNSRTEPVLAPSHPGPTDAIAVIAAQASRIRRRPVTDAPPSVLAWRKLWRGLAAAAAAALLAVTISLMLRPAQHWVAARVVLPEDSPLAERAEMVEAKRGLTGRLQEAGLLVGPSRAGQPPVVADLAGRNLTVRLCSAAAPQVADDLKDLLDRYRGDLQSQFLVAAQTRKQAELALQVASLQAQQADLKARRMAIEEQAGPLAPQASAYDAALAAAGKAREDLDSLAERYNALTAKSRLLRRTPPASRVEVTPEQVAEAAASDPQLVQTRNQVISRAGDLRGLLTRLVQNASAGSSGMDTHLAGFLEFLATQQKQAPDESLQKEIAAIAEPASRLRQIVLDSRKQIDGLAAAIEQAQDVQQAATLVSLHAESEKALESLTAQAAETLQQIDRLLERIPAGGTDVTRRTVLQQRLRSQFAQVQKVHGELTEALDALRPSVNFRLDAALTSVSGLARQLDERSKGLLEQLQQRQARQRRQEYDRQLQETQAQIDDLSIQRDRLLADLTAATDRMLKAEPARSRLLTLRSQQEDLDSRLAALGEQIAAAQARQASLQRSAASQAAPIRVEGPVVEEAIANGPARTYTAIGSAAGSFLVVLAGYLLVVTRNAGRRAAAAPISHTASTN